MIFVLHHAKGALMLAAQDREQVLKWSDRQLGPQPGLVSIFQSESTDMDDRVEKDGTGIEFGQAESCIPVMSIMATLCENVFDAEPARLTRAISRVGRNRDRMRSTLH